MNEGTIGCGSTYELETNKACYNGTYFVPIYTIMTNMNWSINYN